MGRGLRYLALATLVAAPLPAAAAGFAAGPRAGTTGLGAEVGWDLAGALRARVALGAWDEERDVTASGVRYDGELEVRSALALLDWHPGGGGFRLTGGLAWNDNRVVGTAPLAEVFADELADLARRGIDLRGLDLGLARGEALDELIAAEEREIEEEIDGYRLFPVVALGLAFGF